jgi:putative membrane protein
MSGWLLASAHHLLAFLLVAILATELTLCRRGMDGPATRMLGRIDIAYGVVFVLLLAAGIARAGGTNWPLYRDNPLFWTKLALLALAGMMSLPPTIAILRWNRSIRRGGEGPEPAAIRTVRHWMHGEAAVLLLVPPVAAALARGM